MRQKYHRQRPDDLISASEITSWVYCPESWRLEYGLGLEPGNQRSLAAGNQHHARSPSSSAATARGTGLKMMKGYV